MFLPKNLRQNFQKAKQKNQEKKKILILKLTFHR